MNATKLLKRAVAATAGAVELPGFYTLGRIKRIKFDDGRVLAPSAVGRSTTTRKEEEVKRKKKKGSGAKT